MTIAIRGTNQSGAAANGDNVTLTFSTGAGAPQTDDEVIVFGGHGVNTTTLAAPGSGYIEIGIHTGTAPICGAWHKRMGATPDTSVVCSGGGHTSDGVAYCSMVLSGVHADFFDQTTTTAGPTTSTNPDCASITTQTADAWVVAMASSAVNDATITAPSGYSNHITDNGNDAADLTTAGATLAVVEPAPTNPPSWTTWASGAWYGITIALKPALTLSQIAGTSTVTFAPTGTLTGSGALAGSGAVAFSPTAAIAGSGALSGTGTVTFAPTGAVGGTGALSGNSTVTFAPTGTLESVASEALEGASTLAFAPTAALVGAGALTGNAALTLSPAAALIGAGALAGSGTVTFSPAGTLAGVGVLTGNSTLSFVPAAALAGNGVLAGSGTVSNASVATLVGTGALAGDVALTLSPTAILLGVGVLSGSSVMSFTSTSTATGNASAVGTSTITFTPAATLTGAEAETIAGSSILMFAPVAVLEGDGALIGQSTITFTPSGFIGVPELEGGSVRRRRSKPFDWRAFLPSTDWWQLPKPAETKLPGGLQVRISEGQASSRSRSYAQAESRTVRIAAAFTLSPLSPDEMPAAKSCLVAPAITISKSTSQVEAQSEIVYGEGRLGRIEKRLAQLEHNTEMFAPINRLRL